MMGSLDINDPWMSYETLDHYNMWPEYIPKDIAAHIPLFDLLANH